MTQNEKRLLLHQPDVTGGHDFEPLVGAQDGSGVGQAAVVEHGALKEKNELFKQLHFDHDGGKVTTPSRFQ